MILKANEPSANRRYSVLLAGVPGIGKSTLCISGPATLLVETDPGGWDRVPAHCRMADRIVPKDYDEVLGDLVPGNLGSYETIAVDTGGALLNLMKPWVIKQNPKNCQRDGRTLSIQGYGSIAMEFARFVIYIREELRKHFVITFHVKEEDDNDSKVYRLDMDGKSRNEIWKPMDLGGFMETLGNKRTISFRPTDRYYAKGTHGIDDIIELPNVMAGAQNNFLTVLFQRITLNVAEEAKIGEKYKDLMIVVKNIVDGVSNPETANKALDAFKTLEHVFGSKAESWYLLKQKSDALRMGFDKVKNEFYQIPISGEASTKKPETSALIAMKPAEDASSKPVEEPAQEEISF